MNYLAHFYLAQEDEGLIVGNLLSDYYRGNKYLSLPASIQRGVVLHRRIDEFTDNHNEVEKTKIRLRSKYRKYSPVISDVFYDYFLGKNWEEYHGLDLKEYSKFIYDTLHKYQHEFPMQAQLTLGYMSKNDWLYHYSTYYGIEMALKGLSRRATFETNMHEAIADLKKHEDSIEEEFKVFFDDIQDHTQKLIKTL